MLVSVVIPTYDRAGPLLRAVDSVLRQSFRDFELVVVDDGSVDMTEEFIRGYGDPRLKYFKRPHRGVAGARNFGASLARGEWICFLDSDDVWRRHKLSEQIRYHAARPGILISQTDDVWIRDSMRVNKMKKHAARDGDLFRESLKLCLICCSSVMMKKTLFEETGGFDETFPTCEDYDLWLRITAQHPVGFVPKPLVTKFGGHADQLSKKFPVMDAYRIWALEKLLESNVLTQDQMERARQELQRKRTIVSNGRRRKNL
jgi:glycosyltransferase involved in cell wall biosynthesis